MESSWHHVCGLLFNIMKLIKLVVICVFMVALS